MKAITIIIIFLYSLICTKIEAQNHKVRWSVGMDMGGGKYWLSNKRIINSPIQIHLCPCREIDLTKFFIKRNFYQFNIHLGIVYHRIVGMTEINLQQNRSFFIGFNEKNYASPEYFNNQYNINCPTCNYPSPDEQNQKLVQLSLLQWIGYKFNLNSKLHFIFKLGLKYNLNHSFEKFNDNLGWASGCLIQKEFAKNIRFFVRVVYDNLTLIKFKESTYIRSESNVKCLFGFNYLLGL